MSEWRKSSRSGTSGGDCVEVASLAGDIGMRDSKDPHGPKLTLPCTSFHKLVTAIKQGNHDLP
ncbi:DUF397 domain-containing protein [Actinomadura meridiana]|uniref:DUF397 domain-containing protein n=1 Tax=Actinomadura meridiana TaxID=559626 RepID=A0ABP8BZ53_9ACTN